MRIGLACCVAAGVLFSVSRGDAASGCIFKVTGPSGGALYLAGSFHALRQIDYPLPASYNRAFDAADRLAFEISSKDGSGMTKAIPRAAEYPRGDSLRNHVDPRTYSYLQRYFALEKVPEDKFSRYRPWFLYLSLKTGGGEFFGRLGVESFFARRARANSKPIVGLESLKEHVEVFSGLSDRSSEALLLVSLVSIEKGGPDSDRMIQAWRAGNVDSLAAMVHSQFSDFPAMADRLLGVRNRNWIPKLEQYLRSGKTYFVVVGAAHLGGSDGVVKLLEARGCHLQQL